MPRRLPVALALCPDARPEETVSSCHFAHTVTRTRDVRFVHNVRSFLTERTGSGYRAGSNERRWGGRSDGEYGV